MTDKYAVIGNPIAHSKSPQIHKMFAEQTGQDISYEAILAPLDGFVATVERLRREGYKGCNVTVPFKFEAFRIASNYGFEVMDAVESGHEADAVNTLLFKDNKIGGYNTDGTGLVNDIEKNFNIPLKGKRILLIGAGGAAAGVLHPLLEASQSPLAIYNRTLEKAEGLIKKVTQHEKFRLVSIKPVEFGKLGSEQFDIVINATSAGLTDSELPLSTSIFAPGALAYDMMYGRDTPFMKFARANGAAIVTDGLGMLVEQAAESFFIWRGVRPGTAPVIAALRKQQ
ncbi:MAG: shikimate dehydrogenase [Betaproteobacteria bacterium RBG_16_56_24]|nr:MAG: shikimate dehydrogenase [Betaproteobacteria bacterium RBG_16_56_24]